jgi:hypothetical protein
VLFTASYGTSAYSVTGRINAQRPDGSSVCFFVKVTKFSIINCKREALNPFSTLQEIVMLHFQSVAARAEKMNPRQISRHGRSPARGPEGTAGRAQKWPQNALSTLTHCLFLQPSFNHPLTSFTLLFIPCGRDLQNEILHSLHKGNRYACVL